MAVIIMAWRIAISSESVGISATGDINKNDSGSSRGSGGGSGAVLT